MDESSQAPGTRVLQSSEGNAVLTVPEAQLEVTTGPDAGKKQNLRGTTLSVGTDDGNDLVLSDKSISRKHFELRGTEHGILLVDLGSTNGTYVHGYRLDRVYLNRSTVIEAGETGMLFSAQERGIEFPLSRRTDFGQLLGHSPPMRAL